jgi:hypothetical protein
MGNTNTPQADLTDGLSSVLLLFFLIANYAIEMRGTCSVHPVESRLLLKPIEIHTNF